MNHTNIIACIGIALCLSLSACAGPRTFDDGEKAVLRQAQVIKLEVDEIVAANTYDGGVSKLTVESVIKEKIRAAGLTVADEGQDYDASLLVSFLFNKMQLFGQQLPDGATEDTIYMSFELDFRHKKIGRIVRTQMWAIPPPYLAGFQRHHLIRILDDWLLVHLEKK
ncbi:MAG: hypothetical protein AABY96_03320 [Nitrospirota bacterium]